MTRRGRVPHRVAMVRHVAATGLQEPSRVLARRLLEQDHPTTVTVTPAVKDADAARGLATNLRLHQRRRTDPWRLVAFEAELGELAGQDLGEFLLSDDHASEPTFAFRHN